MAVDTVGIKFLYQFALGEYDLNNPGGNVLSVTSTAAGDHDKKNLTTTPLRETWRSASSLTFQDVIMETNDLTVIPDCFAILNHNLTEQAVVQLQASMTSDFTSPAFTIQFVWSKKHMVLLQNVGLAYKYYRFRFLDPLNPCGFIEVGRILAGTTFTMTNNEDITDDISVGTQDLAYSMKSEGFFRAFNERVKVDKINLSFSKLLTIAPDNGNFLGLMEMFDAVGETYPFLTIVDPADQSFQLIWGNVDTLPTRSFSINRYVNMSFAIQEVY
jgi:hypothetical protein